MGVLDCVWGEREGGNKLTFTMENPRGVEARGCPTVCGERGEKEGRERGAHSRSGNLRGVEEGGARPCVWVKLDGCIARHGWVGLELVEGWEEGEEEG